MPSRVHLDFPKIFRFVQFGIDLYSLGMAVQFGRYLHNFIWKISRKNKNTATRRRPEFSACPQICQSVFRNSGEKRFKSCKEKQQMTENPENSQTVQNIPQTVQNLPQAVQNQEISQWPSKPCCEDVASAENMNFTARERMITKSGQGKTAFLKKFPKLYKIYPRTEIFPNCTKPIRNCTVSQEFPCSHRMLSLEILCIRFFMRIAWPCARDNCRSDSAGAISGKTSHHDAFCGLPESFLTIPNCTNEPETVQIGELLQKKHQWARVTHSTQGQMGR